MVRAHPGLVLLFIDESCIEIGVVLAHRIGFSLVKKSSEALVNDMVILKVNGKEISLLPSYAKKIGAALLRKADFADDQQRVRKIS